MAPINAVIELECAQCGCPLDVKLVRTSIVENAAIVKVIPCPTCKNEEPEFYEREAWDAGYEEGREDGYNEAMKERLE